MKYISLYLEGYKPLLHGGTHKLRFTDLTQIVILSGENGKGKSSVLRELTPYPATRSDYEKHGKKILIVEHQGIEYTLTSDFSKTGAHSFIRNDEELNISGTTEVQNDLVNQYFVGFTPIVEKLTSGQCKMSQISRPERNKLIMATYPSPMLFLLEKYKHLMTKIRAAHNQLKLIQERKLKLKEAFIDDSTLQKHNEMRKLMNDSLNALDADMFMLRQSIKPYEEHPLYKKVFDYNLNDVRDRCKEIRIKFKSLMREMDPTHLISSDQLSAEIGITDFDISNMEEQIETAKKRGINLREQIDKYKNYLSTDRDKVIHDCEQMIKIQQDIIKQFTIDDNTPVVDVDEIQQMKDNASTIQNNLDYLKSLNVEIWSEDRFIETERKLHLIEADVRSQLIEKSKLEADINKLQLKLNGYQKYSYPTNCKVVCRLRDSLQEVTSAAQLEFDELNKSRNSLLKEINTNELRINELKNALELRSPARPIIRRFEMLITNKYWGKFICSDHSFVEAVTLNAADIWNRYTRIIKKSEACNRVKKAKDNLVVLEAKLLNLKADTQPAKQIITETVLTLEKELKSTTNLIINTNKSLDKKRYQVNLLKTHKHLVELINLLKNQWIDLKLHMELVSSVNFVKTIISEMQQTKEQVSEKLRELDTIVKEQENLRTRLHDEIEPMIEHISADLLNWQIVERHLSPTKGLPNKLLVRYINEIFRLANNFIAQVWNYDMQLKLINESEDLDFTFPVLLNGDDSVKDISICSKGQKEIIDLAVMLGICTYRKYASMFPLKLDEMTSGLSPDHCNKLFDYLGELLHRADILQTFIVNHDPVTSSVYADASYAVLSQDYPLPTSCHVISSIN